MQGPPEASNNLETRRGQQACVRPHFSMVGGMSTCTQIWAPWAGWSGAQGLGSKTVPGSTLRCDMGVRSLQDLFLTQDMLGLRTKRIHGKGGRRAGH